MPDSISQLSYIQHTHQSLSKDIMFYIGYNPLKLTSFTFFFFILELWAFLGETTDEFLQENISVHVITEHLKIKLKYRNVSTTEESNGENFHKKTCFVSYKK